MGSFCEEKQLPCIFPILKEKVKSFKDRLMFWKKVAKPKDKKSDSARRKSERRPSFSDKVGFNLTDSPQQQYDIKI